jgi:hypothetical protein
MPAAGGALVRTAGSVIASNTKTAECTVVDNSQGKASVDALARGCDSAGSGRARDMKEPSFRHTQTLTEKLIMKRKAGEF